MSNITKIKVDNVVYNVGKTIDSVLNSTSENPIQNKAVYDITTNLQGQINQIEISSSSESVVAPEVSAARVGINSVEYETLKTRIDIENSGLNKGFIELQNGINEYAILPVNGVESSSTGEITASTTRLLFKSKVEANSPIIVKVNGQKVYPHAWTKDGDNFIYAPLSLGWQTDDFTINPSANNYYYDFVVSKLNDGAIIPSECTVSITKKNNNTIINEKNSSDIEQMKAEVVIHDNIIDLSLANTISAAVDQYNKWHTSSSKTYCIPINPEECDEISITASYNSKGVFCLVKYTDTITPVSGESVVYATGSSRYTISEDGGSLTVKVPDDATHLLITKKFQTNSYEYSEVKETRKNSIIADLEEKTKVLDSLVEEAVEVLSYKPIGATIRANGTWNTAQGNSIMIPVKNVSKISLTPIDYNSYISFLVSDYKSNSTDPFFVDGYESRVIINANVNNEYIIPRGCNYVNITIETSTYDISFSKIILCKNFSSDEEIIDAKRKTFNSLDFTMIKIEDGEYAGYYKDIPKNIGVRNAYKKAKQLANIKWTPRGRIPYEESDQLKDTKFLEGTTYTGVNYSSAKECDKLVGSNVSIKTYMTAIHNPYSVMYTEYINSNFSQSAYNITYNGHNCSAYYGTVCSAFLAYVLGFSSQYVSNSVRYYLPDKEIIEVYDKYHTGVQLMDLIWRNGHVRVITDIYRDETGEPVAIFVSESIHPVVSQTKYTPESFDNYIDTKNAIIYRYMDLYKNINYNKSEFVDIDNEEHIEYIYNDDICTCYGDYPCLSTYENLYLNYTKGDYTSIEIYKNDTLIDTITLPDNSSLHTIDITSSLDGAGLYKAKLISSSLSSDFTYWEILDPTVNVEYLGNQIYRIHFSSTRGTPVQGRFCTIDDIYGEYDITDKDIKRGYIDVDFVETTYKQGHKPPANQTLYAKVFFKGEYGVVRNELNAASAI